MSVEDHRFPCDQCGADYRYAPSEGRLICDHCGHVGEMTPAGPWQSTIVELDFKTALAGALEASEIEETRVMSCTSCGAQVEFDERIHAKECPFCATPVVTGTGTHRHIKPKGLLPFGVDEPAARAAMNAWLGRLWFAPSGLQDYARKGRRMQGIYVPFWTFDAQTASRYSGARGIVHYESRSVMRQGKRQRVRVAQIRWTPVSGRVSRFFDDVLILASRALPKRYTDALEPWDLSEMEPYTPEYIAGFRAEGYQVELPDGFTEARAAMDRVIARDVRFDIGGDRQRIERIETSVKDVTFKHVLLPVWLAAYKFRGETYRFVVNGRTGKVQGERPYSTMKIAFAVLAGLIVAGIVGYGAALSEF